MGANDSPLTTRSIVSDYFDWRLNNKIPTTNNRLFNTVRRIASDCETAYYSQQPTFNFHLTSPLTNLQTLTNIQSIHNEIAKEIFVDGNITWPRIITLIAFSAILTQHLIQQATLSSETIISAVIDWTSNLINTDFQTWLESENYWVGFLKLYDKTPQRRQSIGRYTGLIGCTIGMLTLGALYIRRN